MIRSIAPKRAHDASPLGYKQRRTNVSESVAAETPGCRCGCLGIATPSRRDERRLTVDRRAFLKAPLTGATASLNVGAGGGRVDGEDSERSDDREELPLAPDALELMGAVL